MFLDYFLSYILIFSLSIKTFIKPHPPIAVGEALRFIVV